MIFASSGHYVQAYRHTFENESDPLYLEDVLQSYLSLWIPFKELHIWQLITCLHMKATSMLPRGQGKNSRMSGYHLWLVIEQPESLGQALHSPSNVRGWSDSCNARQTKPRIPREVMITRDRSTSKKRLMLIYCPSLRLFEEVSSPVVWLTDT